MLGARLKSWVEAHLGRAKRRKQKQSRPAPPVPSTGPIPPAPHLSSPESAYSTGYSTDGTSPGAPPVTTLAAPLVAPPPPPTPPTTHLYHEPSKRRGGSCGGTRKALPEVPVICATPSPRPRCRIRTNPWLGATSPNARRRHHQTTGLHCQPPSSAHYAIYNGDLHGASGALIPRSPHISPLRSPYYRCGSSDEECLNGRIGPPETAILSDADVDTDGDTGLDGGDEEESEDNIDSPSRRRARRRRPPRRTPKSAGATPPRVRRRNYTPPAPPARERDPILEADREAERKYRELIREAEKLLVSVSRAPLEPPHNPRIRELKATEVEIPRRSPERTHITNFMRANSPEPPRRLSPVAKRSPLAVPALVPPPVLPRIHHMQPPPVLTDRPHSEPPKRKTYAREEVLQTLEGLRRSLQQQSALLAVQRTRLDSF